MTEVVQRILSNYPSDNPGSRANIARILNHGRLGGTGKIVVLPVDQGFEHGPARSFATNAAGYDPFYHAELAIDAGCSAYAAPLGFIDAIADRYAGELPLILKVNNHDSLSGERDPIPAQTSTVADALRKVAAFSENPTVYYVVGFGEGGDWTAGGDTFIGQMIEMAGAVNIAADVTGWSFSLELIVDRDPDLILLPDWAETLFKTTPIYSDLRAVGNGNTVAFDENAIVRQGPRLADGFASLVDIIGSAH